MVLLLVFAFLSGLVTIFAPCVWPVLPIILSSSSTGGARKPFGITVGIMVSFGLLTLFTSALVKLIPFDANILRYVAVFVIGGLGITLVIPKLSAVLETQMSRLSGKLSQPQTHPKVSFFSGFLTGLSLGIIWTPCAGPILATIATLSATQKVTTNVVLVTISYVVGVGIPLFLFATFGRYLFSRSRILSKYTGRVQQIFGVLMIVIAVAIATHYDTLIQARLLDFFPSYSQFLTSIERTDTVTKELSRLKQEAGSSVTDFVGKVNTAAGQAGLLNENSRAPDFVGITKWLNTQNPLTMSDLRGKVILVDFWTYTCINCIRTLPFVTSWYDKYRDKGFVVIGVHTPEFEFEKSTSNVMQAIDQYKIHYPVAQDNNYATWNNFSNQYWPAEYLIDAKGIIRRTHFGEGEYDQMESAIQLLLKDAGQTVSTRLENIQDQTPKIQLSPETYIGAKRMEYYYPTGTLSTGKQSFTFVASPKLNSFSLGGEWNILDEYSTTGNSATLSYSFTADKVFLVLRPPSGTVAKITVLLDGKKVTQSLAGSDVRDGVVTVDTDRLYSLIDLKGNAGNHTLELHFETPGTEVFAFTFG